MKALISIPHSGEIIEDEFRPFLIEEKKHLYQDVDSFVDQLVDIEALNEKGISVIIAHHQRVCVDLNRSPDKALLNWEKNSRGVKIVKARPSVQEERKLIQHYHAPYFTMLKSLIEHGIKEQSHRFHFVDLHSMPSRPTAYHLSITPDQPMTRPDFCVSDISGKSASDEYMSSIVSQLETFSNNVTRNIPYFGGHITRWVDQEFPSLNNIQIEISRATYMNEETRVLIEDKAKKLKKNLTKALLNHHASQY